jgi:hypothetical protein
MRPVIPDLLWIGNAFDLRDVKAVLSYGIRAVVDLAANEPPVLYPRDIAYCRLPLNDGADNDPATLRLAVHSTAEFVKARAPTLIACSAGMSRSPAVAAAALALVERQKPDDVLLRIASSGPHDVAPALWADIKRILFSLDDCLSFLKAVVEGHDDGLKWHHWFASNEPDLRRRLSPGSYLRLRLHPLVEAKRLLREWDVPFTESKRFEWLDPDSKSGKCRYCGQVIEGFKGGGGQCPNGCYTLRTRNREGLAGA